MKNKWKGLLSKEIPLSALKKTLALFLAVLMVVTSSDFSGLYGMGEVKAEGERNDISITGSSTADGTNKLTMSVSSNTKDSQLSAYNVLGDAWNYGITAEEYSHEVGGDSETNFAVKTIDKFPSQSGITGKAYFSRICDSYIGEIADGCIVKIKGIPNVSTIHRIFTPCSKDKFDADGGSQFVWVMTDPETEKSEFKHDKGVTVEIHPTSKDKVDSYVDGLISKVSTEGNTLLGKDSVADYSKLPSFTQNSYKLKLDLTNAPDGTYYFNLDKYKALYEALSSQAGGLSINKNPGQTVVFNSSRQTDSDHPITIQKFNINDIGTDTIADSDQTNNCMEYASSIIFNFPNAGNVNLNAFAGIVLAPNAIVTNDSGASAGWLVAKKVVAKAEWHFLNSKLTTEAAPPVQFKAIKTIDNNDIGDKTPKFSFKLEERGVDGSFKQIQTVNNNGSAINFNQIKYTGKDDGTHIYRITEVAGDNSQYTYDTSTYYVKVDVSTKVVGNVEKTSADVSYYSNEACTDKLDANKVVFDNKTKNTASGSLSLTGMKTVNKGEPQGQTFNFGLYQTIKKDGQLIGEANKEIDQAVSNASTGSFGFTKIIYNQDDIGKIYSYIIKEENVPAGYRDTTNSKTLNVKIEAGEDGSLKLVQVNDDGTEIGELPHQASDYSYDYGNYNNYTAQGSLVLSGTKTVNRAPTQGFTFALTEVKKANGKETSRSLNPATSGADGKFYFDKITYGLGDVGEYTYILTESGDYPGYTDQTHQKTLTVKVEDNGDGTLKVSRKTDDNQTEELKGSGNAYTYDFGTYENTYSAEGTIELKGHKTVDGNALKSGEKFNFELKDQNKNVVATAETDANGDFTFRPKTKKDLHYTDKDAGKTFTYTISETAKDGYTPDDKNPTTVEVSVSDNRSGKLTVTAKYPDAKAYYDDSNQDDPTPLYNNTYAASGSLVLSGKKVVEGRALDKDFEFQLTEVDENGNPIEGKQPLTATAYHAKNGAFEFTAIDYHKDAQRDDTGLHYYQLTETSQYPGYTDLTQKKTLTVSVTDNGDGTLKVSRVDGSNIENLKGSGNAYTYDFGTYKNSYTAKPAALILSGNKTLTGADLSQYAGLFRFDLQDASKKTIDTAKNDTAGRFTFAPLVFDKAGDYTYTISEINGGKTIDGIAYDNSVYTVKVTVTDNNEGQLVASTSIAKDGKKVDDENQAISFTNKKLTEVTVNKNWNDSSNQEGLRPDSITLELLKNGQVVGTTKLSGTGDNWSYTFRDLEPANYTVHESSDSPYYEVDHNDLTADTTKGDQAVTLTNTFGRKIDLTAYKDLTGAKLLDGEFHFRLHRNSDADSSKDIEAVNNADGTINFTDVDYDAKGYTVYELRDSSMTDISFDENNSVDPANTNPIDYTKTGIQFHADGTPADDNNYTIRNEYRPIVLRVQKRSKSAPYDPLVNAVYGLYQVNANGNDILVESELSDANGYMYYGRIEPNTVYYFKEISAPEGHEVGPYPGQHFMVKYVGNGQIAVYDETGTQKLDYGDITESPEEKDKPYRTIQVNTEKTDLDSITVSENEEKYTYSGDGVKAVATAAKGVLPEGTRLAVKKVDPKTQTASYQSPTGIKTQSLETMLENNVGDFTGLAYYDISFMNGDEEVEPTGDVHVTLEPDQALDLQGADPSDLKIVHIVESGEPEDLTRTVSLVTGSVASDGKSVLQTSLTSDSFSVYALVDPKDSTLNGNYMLTAAGVGDFPAKLRVAKVDSSGNFIPNATLCVYKFDATKKDGLGEKVLEWTSAEGVQDWQRKVDVETPYVLVETNAPKGYKIADNIYFSIGKYNSALTCYAYDEKTGKLTESQELTQKCTNGSELIMVDDPIMVTTNYKTKVIPNHKSRTENKVLYVPGSPKTGEFTASMPWALPLASAAVVLLILTGYLLGKKKRSRK